MPDRKPCPTVLLSPTIPTSPPVLTSSSGAAPSPGPVPPLRGALDLLADPVMTRRTARDTPTAYALGRTRSGWTVVADRPLDRIVGWRAPASCRAVAVVTSGRVLPGDAARHRDRDPVGDLDSVRGCGSVGDHGSVGDGVEVAVAVDRSGTTAARLTVGGQVDDHAPRRGRLLDTLLRTLDLPTPPPPEDTVRLVAVLWLAAIARATVDPCVARSLDWREALGLHPAVRLLAGVGEKLRLDQMQQIVTITPSTWTWDVLREAESAHGAMAPLCPAGAAAWMDDGMYARWVLADLPPLEGLRSRLDQRLTTAVARRLGRTLSDIGPASVAPVGVDVAC